MKFVVYDFETSGRSARYDQILQAGIILYDKDLNEIQQLNLKSRINADIIPSISALNVNGIFLPDLLHEKKTSFEMIKEMNDFFETNKPLMFLGYNSLNFDEEFLRQGLWENFLYPYITTSSENRRGDVLNLVRMAHAIDPDIIKILENEDGKLSFKLENLSKINNFNILRSHEAISDVIATKNLFEIIKNKSSMIFENFIENTDKKLLIEKIKLKEFFTLHASYYGKHYFYLLTHFIDHPVYKDNFLLFDLKYDPSDLVDLSQKQLSEVYFSSKKKYFRKIKLNKQPAILSEVIAINRTPYDVLDCSDYLIRRKKLENSELKERIKKILIQEAESFQETKSQLLEFEEDTIYKQNINYNDKLVMGRFHNIDWDGKWEFAEKFKDKRLRYFAAKHIYRNNPHLLPKKVFKYFHEKVSERLNSIENRNFLTLPAAMEEADNLLLKYENSDKSIETISQLEQYNTYINFLSDYYSKKNTNPNPICFDQSLSKKLFGK